MKNSSYSKIKGQISKWKNWKKIWIDIYSTVLSLLFGSECIRTNFYFWGTNSSGWDCLAGPWLPHLAHGRKLWRYSCGKAQGLLAGLVLRGLFTSDSLGESQRKPQGNYKKFSKADGYKVNTQNLIFTCSYNEKLETKMLKISSW